MDQKNTDRRVKRSERAVPVYEGKGESIRPRSSDDASVRRPAVVKAAMPGKTPRQPKGRSEELQERLRYGQTGQRQPQRPSQGSGRREYRETMYDDFDAYADVRRPEKKRRRKKDPHRGLWLMVILLCVGCMAVLGVLVMPQLLGLHIPGLPSFAFANGSILTLDQAEYEQYRRYRQYMDTDAIYPGVYVDGVHVGGMTVEEAENAVWLVGAQGGGAFSVTVNVGNGSWIIDSTQVPMVRNVEEMVQQAYACGRENTTSIRGTRVTPFQERLNTAMNMRTNPVSLSTELTYDRTAVRQLTDSIAAYVNRDPVNASVASFDFNSRSFTFNSDTPGAYIDPESLYQQVTAKIDAGEVNAVITVEPEKILAQVTKAELMNSFRKVSSYTTDTTSNSNRNTNIRLSAEAINGTTVLPGETFSFNKATGERTAAKGYLPAAAIAGGQSVDEIGGGVCQTSSTLFNAVARADLEIVYRSPHAWPSNYVDKGMDATVNWPNLDFKFRNDTDWPVFIVSYYKNRKVTVEIYGMGLNDGMTIDLESEVIRTIEAPSDIKYEQNPQLAPGTQKETVKARKGYEVVTYQVWYHNGKEVDRIQLCKSTYKAYQAVVEYN
ncbi:MAG: VanW family protein [Clostridia bacterium]|nr:VanW family protein [Clostridia bacterium]